LFRLFLLMNRRKKRYLKNIAKFLTHNCLGDDVQSESDRSHFDQLSAGGTVGAKAAAVGTEPEIRSRVKRQTRV